MKVNYSPPIGPQALKKHSQNWEVAVNKTDEEIAEEGADAVNQTEEEKTEKAVENLRKRDVADVKAVEAFNETLEVVACAPAVNENYELSLGLDSDWSGTKLNKTSKLMKLKMKQKWK